MSESLFRANTFPGCSLTQGTRKHYYSLEFLVFQLSCPDSQGQPVCLPSASLHLPPQTRPAFTEMSSPGYKYNARFQVQTAITLYWNGQLVWTPALALYLCVGDRGPGTGDCVQRDLSPTSGYTGISARRRYAIFFNLQSVPTRSLSTLVG